MKQKIGWVINLKKRDDDDIPVMKVLKPRLILAKEKETHTELWIASRDKSVSYKNVSRRSIFMVFFVLFPATFFVLWVKHALNDAKIKREMNVFCAKIFNISIYYN